MPPRSRVLAALLAGAACVLAGGGAAQAQSAPVPVRVGVIPAEVAGEAFYALDEGFFRQAGLDVKLETFNNGGAIAAAVAGGALDVGLSDLLAVIDAHARGVPFVFVAPGVVNRSTAAASTIGLLVRPGEAIREAKDFDGKTIATNQLHNIGQLFAEAWIDANGGDSKTVKWVEMPYPALVPALLQGTVQAVGTNEPWMTVGVLAGARPVYYERNPIAPLAMLGGWVGTRDWAAQHAATAAKFAAAIEESGRWANRNRAAAAAILAKHAKLPPGTIARMHRSEFAERFDPATVQPVVDAAARYGLIPKPFPAAEILLGR